MEISVGLFASGGAPALVDGSIVYVIATPNTSGSGLGPVSWGGSLIADSTQGSEVLIATISLDSTTFSGNPDEGTHAQAWTGIFPDNYGLYLRFFNTTVSPVSGTVGWGQTDIITPYDVSFGFAFFDFDGDYETDQTNSFTVIPEPGTMSLMVLAAAILFGWVHLRRTLPLAAGNTMPDHFDRVD